MPLYNYMALDKAGNEVQGQIQATSQADALKHIRAKGLFTNSIGIDQTGCTDSLGKSIIGKLCDGINPVRLKQIKVVAISIALLSPWLMSAYMTSDYHIFNVAVKHYQKKKYSECLRKVENLSHKAQQSERGIYLSNFCQHKLAQAAYEKKDYAVSLKMLSKIPKSYLFYKDVQVLKNKTVEQLKPSGNMQNSPRVPQYRIVEVEDVSCMAFGSKPLSHFTPAELDSLPKSIRKVYRVVLPKNCTRASIEAALAEVVNHKSGQDPEIDAITIFAYDDERDIDSFYTVAKMVWGPNGAWDGVTGDIAKNNDRTTYRTAIAYGGNADIRKNESQVSHQEIYPASERNPKGVSFSSNSLEYKLASINAGHFVAKNDEAVATISRLLNQLSTKFVESRQEIGDISVKAQEILKDEHINESLINIMVGMNLLFPQKIENQKYSEFISVYIVLRTKGQSHGEAIRGLRALLDQIGA